MEPSLIHLPPADLEKLCENIVRSISNRGQPKEGGVECIIRKLFASAIEKPGQAVSPITLLEHCWGEKADEFAASEGKVRGAVHRTRDVLANYFQSLEGRREHHRVVIPVGKYHLSIEKNHAAEHAKITGPIKKSTTIGLLCNPYEWFAMDLIRGVEAGAREAERNLIVSFQLGDSLKNELEELQRLCDRCAGVIAVPSPSKEGG